MENIDAPFVGFTSAPENLPRMRPSMRFDLQLSGMVEFYELNCDSVKVFPAVLMEKL